MWLFQAWKLQKETFKHSHFIESFEYKLIYLFSHAIHTKYAQNLSPAINLVGSGPRLQNHIWWVYYYVIQYPRVLIFMTWYFTVDRASLLLTPQIWIFSLLKYLSGLIRLLLDDRALRVTRSGVRMAQSGPSSLPSSSVFRSLMDDEHQDQFRAWNCNWQWGINIQIGEQELGITQSMVVWHQTIIWNRDERL